MGRGWIADSSECWIRKFLKEALIKGDYFSFYNRFPISIRREFLLDGTNVVSRVDLSADSMSIYYTSGSLLLNREMKQPFAGYFSCPIAVVDVDEACYCKSIKDRSMQLWKAVIHKSDRRADKKTRVELINELAKLESSGNRDEFRRKIYAYVGVSDSVNERFTTL